MLAEWIDFVSLFQALLAAGYSLSSPLDQWFGFIIVASLHWWIQISFGRYFCFIFLYLIFCNQTEHFVLLVIFINPCRPNPSTTLPPRTIIDATGPLACTFQSPSSGKKCQKLSLISLFLSNARSHESFVLSVSLSLYDSAIIETPKNHCEPALLYRSFFSW